MSLRIVIASGLLLFFACRSEERPVPPAATARAVQLSPAASAAYQRLLHAERFADSMVGEDGGLPPEALDLRLVVQEDPTGNACAELFHTASTGGRLFALCGLWWRDSARFQKGVQELRGSRELITFHTGCEILTDMPVGELVQQRNGIRLDGRRQTLLDWLDKHPGESAQLDIAGGGYPQRLLALP
jgi:hypothetical protein